MTRIETEVYKQAADDLIGLRVIVYDDAERQINNIIVVQPEDLIRLETGLVEHNHDNKYVSIESVSQRIRQIAEELFATTQQQNYRPPTFYVEDDGDFYVEYHEGELITHDEIVINLENKHIITYDGNFTITGLITNNEEPLINRNVLIYNINDTSEQYFNKTNRNGIITFNLSLDIPNKTYKVTTSGVSEDIEVTYHKYDLKIIEKDCSVENEFFTLHGMLTDFDEPVQGQDISLYKNDTLIGTNPTDENGMVNFNVTTDIDGNIFKIKFNDYEDESLINLHEMLTWEIPLDGTETIEKIENYNATINDNIMTANCASLINDVWSNLEDWEIEFDAQLSYRTGTAIWSREYNKTNSRTRDKFEILIDNEASNNNSVGNLHIIIYSLWGWKKDYNLTSFFTTNFPDLTLHSDWNHFHIIRDREYLKFYINDILALTFDSKNSKEDIGQFLWETNVIGLDSWDRNSYSKIKNIKIKGYKQPYRPLLQEVNMNVKKNPNAWKLHDYYPQVVDNNIIYSNTNSIGYFDNYFVCKKYWSIEYKAKITTNSACWALHITGDSTYDYADFILCRNSGGVPADRWYVTINHNNSYMRFNYDFPLNEWFHIKVEKISMNILRCTFTYNDITKSFITYSNIAREYKLLSPYIHLWDRTEGYIDIDSIKCKVSTEEPNDIAYNIWKYRDEARSGLFHQIHYSPYYHGLVIVYTNDWISNKNYAENLTNWSFKYTAMLQIQANRFSIGIVDDNYNFTASKDTGDFSITVDGETYVLNVDLTNGFDVEWKYKNNYLTLLIDDIEIFTTHAPALELKPRFNKWSNGALHCRNMSLTEI